MFNKINESLATKWFKKAVDTIGSKMPKGMIDVKTSNVPPIGEIALFRYDPKLKDTLPYYDTHPLVLICNFTSKDVYGINLHYVPPPIRKKLVDKMAEIKTRHPGDSKAAQLSYIREVLPYLESFGNSDLFSFTYKHYLIPHIRSRFGIINRSWWKLVIKLPLQDFKKATAKQVWADAERLKTKRSRKFGF